MTTAIINEFRLLGEYNRLMNQRLYDCASQLSDHDLRRDQGAFFKSVIGTLNHILVGDIIWLQRFSSHRSSRESLAYINGLTRPKSLDAILHNDLPSLWRERSAVDEVIVQWTHSLSEADLSASITYRNMVGDTVTKPYSSLITHLFLHQVHHRGQATTLLSQSGLDFGDTDLIELIAERGVGEDRQASRGSSV